LNIDNKISSLPIWRYILRSRSSGSDVFDAMKIT